jgi:hypothetical protein
MLDSKFQNSLLSSIESRLSSIESRLCSGPISFDCCMNITISLKDKHPIKYDSTDHVFYFC